MTIKLTKNQADAVEKIKTEQRRRIKAIKAHPNLYHVKNWEKPLFELEADDIQRALFDGYEVEPEFEENQWIVVTSSFHGNYGKVQKIIEITDACAAGKDLAYHLEDGSCRYKNEIRHATPEEIAQEKERRTDKKLDKLLLDLSNEERVRLAKKLDGDHE
ncbi:hypothetical protein KK120_08855 [Virgibacillus dakarensis]|nr:hypothetical protein [Virgibacillus dakarensis]MBT2215931.1 hypothetical protein [Virgibacillus dakarensis]